MAGLGNNTDQTLTSLLSEDRELVMAQLEKDPSQEAALRTLEKETDRLMYRAGQLEKYTEEAQSVQGILQAVKYTLPLVESVSKSEVWERESPSNAAGLFSPGTKGWICLGAGLVCAVSALAGQAFAGGFLHIGALLLLLAGCALLIAGGYFAGRGPKESAKRGGAGKGSAWKDGTWKGSAGKGDAQSALRKQTFLVDPAQVWHVLQGVMLSADHSLEEEAGREKSAALSSAQENESALTRAEMSFFPELLERAYAARRRMPSDDSMTEQIESIRYYLHSRGVETVDYTKQSAAWFELLPGQGTLETIRPALVSGESLIRKGIASV